MSSALYTVQDFIADLKNFNEVGQLVAEDVASWLASNHAPEFCRLFMLGKPDIGTVVILLVIAEYHKFTKAPLYFEFKTKLLELAQKRLSLTSEQKLAFSIEGQHASSFFSALSGIDRLIGFFEANPYTVNTARQIAVRLNRMHEVEKVEQDIATLEKKGFIQKIDYPGSAVYRYIPQRR